MVIKNIVQTLLFSHEWRTSAWSCLVWNQRTQIFILQTVQESVSKVFAEQHVPSFDNVNTKWVLRRDNCRYSMMRRCCILRLETMIATQLRILLYYIVCVNAFGWLLSSIDTILLCLGDRDVIIKFSLLLLHLLNNNIITWECIAVQCCSAPCNEMWLRD